MDERLIKALVDLIKEATGLVKDARTQLGKDR